MVLLLMDTRVSGGYLCAFKGGQSAKIAAITAFTPILLL